jgi:hypothetical protein
MRLAINFPSVSNVRDGNGFVGIIHFVKNAVISEANPPTLPFRQLLTSGWTRILTQGFDFAVSNGEFLLGQALSWRAAR